MKTLFLLFIGSFLFLQMRAQMISGTVFDKKTNEKVSFASIYFSGTFVGTISDINGNFTLDVSKNASMPLSVSCIGYYSQTLSNYSSTEPLTIFLDPKDFQINEIVVSAKSLVRKRKAALRLFKNEFLGSSINAGSCEIMNEDDISFNYGSDSDTLKAFASKPILIRNKALGYEISYYLDKFEYYRNNKAFTFSGNILFKEDEMSSKNVNQNTLIEKRNEVYLGSRMHFLRSLWANQLTAAGFSITTSDGKSVRYNEIIIQEAGNLRDTDHQIKKFLSYPFSLLVYYGVESSVMTIQSQRVYIDKNGYDATGIFWEGEMLKKRIGDALPFEYGMPK